MEPTETLYIKNLNDKIPLNDLRYSLFFLFTPFGDLFDICAKRCNAMRGQAFIIFKEKEGAELALKSLNGYKVFGKGMRISFSKKKSKALEFMQRASKMQ